MRRHGLSRRLVTSRTSVNSRFSEVATIRLIVFSLLYEGNIECGIPIFLDFCVEFRLLKPGTAAFVRFARLTYARHGRASVAWRNYAYESVPKRSRKEYQSVPKSVAGRGKAK